MLRSTFRAFRQIYTCTCLNKLVPASGYVSGLPSTVRAIQTSVCLNSIDKDIRDKKSTIKRAHASKEEHLDPDDGSFSVEGLTEAGITVPTLETHSMLIDGVRYDELPIVHIKSSLNNTIILCTDYKGLNVIARVSCGTEGFKNVKKSTNVAAQTTGLAMGNRAIKRGVRHVRVQIQGLGAGRLASIKGLQMAGLNIVSITDNTPIPCNGPRPRKARRL